MGKPRTIYASSSINVNQSEMVAVPREVGLVLPQRPAEPDCLYFLKHGRCKYGSTCKYHHPMNTTSPVNINNDPVRYEYAMYAVPNTTGNIGGERARSISTGSYSEIRDQPTNTMHMNMPLYPPVDHEGRIVDSVPTSRGSRNDTLNTISNYHMGNMNGNATAEWQRFYKPEGTASQIGSPSVTSSTIASSYETAVSNMEKIPQAVMAQQHQSLLGRSLHDHSHHSQEDAALTFEDAMMPPVHDGSRIPGIPHYRKPQMQRRVDATYEQNGVTGRPPSNDGRKVKSEYNGNKYTQQTQGNGRGPSGPMPQRPSKDRAVDDGLSQMTSALLTMLDTPETRKTDTASTSNASTVSAGNLDDLNSQGSINNVTPPFLSTSLPEYMNAARQERRISSGQNSQDVFMRMMNNNAIGQNHPIRPEDQSANFSRNHTASYNRTPYPMHPSMPPRHNGVSYGQNHVDDSILFSSRPDGNMHNRHYSMGSGSDSHFMNHHDGSLPVPFHPSQQQYQERDQETLNSSINHKSEAIHSMNHQTGEDWNPNSDTVGGLSTQFFLS
jgi:hypothetical protein